MMVEFGEDGVLFLVDVFGVGEVVVGEIGE